MESQEGRADRSPSDPSPWPLKETVNKHANGQSISPVAKILPGVLGCRASGSVCLESYGCYPVIFAPLMGKRSVIVEGCQNPATPFWHSRHGPFLKWSILVSVLLLSFLEIEEPSPPPLG